MDDLATKIRDAHERGIISHLSIAFFSGLWHASAAATHTGAGFAHASHADPVTALETALHSAAKGRPRKPKNTATVTSADIPPGAVSEPTGNTFADFLPQVAPRRNGGEALIGKTHTAKLAAPVET